MKAVIQRVKRASIVVDGEIVGSIGPGLFVMIGLQGDDSEADLDWIAGKISRLRVFEDDSGKMNLSVGDVGGQLAIVSEFTLYGDLRRGNRPSYSRAMAVEAARSFWPRVEERFSASGIECAVGRFQALMECEIVNDGPVTLILDSDDRPH